MKQKRRPPTVSPPRGARGHGRDRLALLLTLLIVAGVVWAFQARQRSLAAKGAMAVGHRALAAHDNEAASRAFRRALQSDPKLPEAHTQLGRLSLQQGNTEAAILHFRTVVERRPKDAEARTDLGIAHLEGGEWTDAVAAFRHATRLDARSAAALRGLGEAYRRSQRWDDAVATLEKARQLEPEDGRGLYLLGLALAQRGRAPHDPLRALELLSEARQKGAPESSVHYAMGLAHLASDRVEDAVTELETALRLKPDDDQVLFRLGEAYRRIGRSEAARRALETYHAHAQRRQELRGLRERVAAEPENREHRRRLAEACIGAGDYRGALQHLATLSNTGAEDADLYDLYARAWDGLGLKVPADQARALAAKSRAAP